VFPADWTGFKVHYRFGETIYHVTVLQSPNHDGEMRRQNGRHSPRRQYRYVDERSSGAFRRADFRACRISSLIFMTLHRIRLAKFPALALSAAIERTG